MNIRKMFENTITDYQQKIDNQLKDKYKIKDSDIKTAQNEMAKYWGVDPKFMSYVSVYEPGMNNMVWFMFNITDPKHKYYKSSKIFKWLPKSDRGVAIAKNK